MDITAEKIQSACRLVRPMLKTSAQGSGSVLSGMCALWGLDSCVTSWEGLMRIAGKLHAKKYAYDKPTRRRLIWLLNAFKTKTGTASGISP